MKLWTIARIFTFSLTGLSVWLAGNRAVLAQARPESVLPPEIERSLVEDSAPNFFQQGLARFEQEIQRLSDNQRTAGELILQIHPDTRYRDVPEGADIRDLELQEQSRRDRDEL